MFGRIFSGFLMAFACATAAFGNAYPERPIRLIVSYPHELSGEACHRHAVDMLLAKFARENAKKFGSTPEDHHWGKYITGGLGSGQMVHVLLGRRGSALADAGLDADAARDLVSGLVMAEGGAR